MNVGVMAGTHTTHTQTELSCSFSRRFCFWMSVKREPAGAYRLEELHTSHTHHTSLSRGGVEASENG